MHHLILGYGYCGYYLAQELIANNQPVTAVSRQNKPEFMLSGLNCINHDINLPFLWNKPNTIVYYLIPPPNEGYEDFLLTQFLKNCSFKPHKVIYFGSSAVYGNHQGEWVDEKSACYLNTPREFRRLDAEKKWISYCEKHAINYVLMRISGIYGPKRIPLKNVLANEALVKPEEAPYANYINVLDLVKIAEEFAFNPKVKGVFNIADGNPQKMGTLQRLLRELLNLSPAPEVSLEEALQTASPMKQEFLLNSRRLDISALLENLEDWKMLDLRESLKQYCMRRYSSRSFTFPQNRLGKCSRS